MTFAARLPRRLRSLATLGILAGSASAVQAQMARGKTPDDPMATIPKLATLVSQPAARWPTSSIDTLPIRVLSNRRYDANDSPEQRRRMREFYTGWRDRLGEIELRQAVAGGTRRLRPARQSCFATSSRCSTARTRIAPRRRALLPFADRLLALQDTRRTLAPVDPRAAAKVVADVAKQVDSLRALFEAPAGRGGAGGRRCAGVGTGDTARPRPVAPRVTRTVANRGADNVDQIRGIVSNWYRYYDGYDPMFSWWLKDPYREAR